MSEYSKKLRYLLPPYIILCMVLSGAYVIFYGSMQQHPYYLEFSFYHILVPLLLPIVPSIVFLRPRVKKVVFKKEWGFNLILFFASLLLIAPLVTAANYSRCLFGESTIIDKSTKAIDTTFQFYEIKDYRLDAKNGAYSYRLSQPDSTASNGTVSIDLELTAPIIVKGRPENHKGGALWVAMAYTNGWDINLYHSKEEVQNKVETFINEKTIDFYNGYSTFRISHFEKLQDDFVKNLTLDAIREKNPGLTKDAIVFLVPVFRSVQGQTMYYFWWFTGSIAISILGYAFILKIPSRLK